MSIVKNRDIILETSQGEIRIRAPKVKRLLQVAGVLSKLVMKYGDGSSLRLVQVLHDEEAFQSLVEIVEICSDKNKEFVAELDIDDFIQIAERIQEERWAKNLAKIFRKVFGKGESGESSAGGGRAVGDTGSDAESLLDELTDVAPDGRG